LAYQGAELIIVDFPGEPMLVQQTTHMVFESQARR